MKAPLLKPEKYTRYVIILIASIYLISVLERVIKKENAPSELLIEHAVEKARMEAKIDLLNDKIHDYEIKILKNRIDVSNMSNSQLDSTWATIFN